jgi:hypothetical protein
MPSTSARTRRGSNRFSSLAAAAVAAAAAAAGAGAGPTTRPSARRGECMLRGGANISDEELACAGGINTLCGGGAGKPVGRAGGRGRGGDGDGDGDSDGDGDGDRACARPPARPTVGARNGACSCGRSGSRAAPSRPVPRRPGASASAPQPKPPVDRPDRPGRSLGRSSPPPHPPSWPSLASSA